MRSLRPLGAASVLALAIVAAPAALPAGAQTVPEPPAGIPGLPSPGTLPAPGPPLPTLPTIPPEAAPVQGLLAPVGWQACNTTATALFVAMLGSGLLPGLPLPAELPVNGITIAQLVAGYANPALGMACGAFGPPVSAPACSTDGSLGVIPFLSLHPTGTAVSQLEAVENLPASAGAPTAGTVSGPVGGALGCMMPEAGGGSGLPDLDVPRITQGVPGTPPAAAGGTEVLGESITSLVDGVTGSAPGIPVATGGTTTIAADADEQAAALAASSQPEWTLARIVGVALLAALGFVLAIRWLAIAER